MPDARTETTVDAAGVPDEPTRGRRAAPMSPDDRRDAILVAAIPLLRRRGAGVTTRELADAACVAEGTLFRVFPDKAALVRAALERALDPTPVLTQLAGVEQELPVRIAVAKVVAILQEHAAEVAGLLSVSHELAGGHPRPGHGRGPHDEHPVEKVVRAVAAVLQPRRAHLRMDGLVCARMLVGLVMAANRPLTAGAAPVLDAHQISALFCDGALTSPDTPEDPC